MECYSLFAEFKSISLQRNAMLSTFFDYMVRKVAYMSAENDIKCCRNYFEIAQNIVNLDFYKFRSKIL